MDSLPHWPLVRWTRYGRWSEDGRRVYASGDCVEGTRYDLVIYDVSEERTLGDALAMHRMLERIPRL